MIQNPLQIDSGAISGTNLVQLVSVHTEAGYGIWLLQGDAKTVQEHTWWCAGSRW